MAKMFAFMFDKEGRMKVAATEPGNLVDLLGSLFGPEGAVSQPQVAEQTAAEKAAENLCGTCHSLLAEMRRIEKQPHTRDNDKLMSAAYASLLGHHILCSYYMAGDADYAKAIEEVNLVGKEIYGLPIPYTFGGGEQ